MKYDPTLFGYAMRPDTDRVRSNRLIQAERRTREAREKRVAAFEAKAKWFTLSVLLPSATTAVLTALLMRVI